jgi:hypothetical protein
LRLLLSLGRRPAAAVPVGTAAIATIAARTAPAPVIAIARGLLLLFRLLVLLTPAAAVTASIRAVLPSPGGFRRGPAQQGQDHRGRDQTFHVFQVLQGALAPAPSLIPCSEVSALLHEPRLNDDAHPTLQKGDPP